ncbi:MULTISPECIES: response regulator [unclassified Flavobacterium]|uniref:response regulator n=1 Tax=unclassified Flavobacterium TaxID=196869 RepID=UPI001F13BC1E|nr:MULTISPECIES: response regulator [unclassified Flavobacterium]UMY64334.1 response regulator [Flavobacterium sp. HJ-32-4]
MPPKILCVDDDPIALLLSKLVITKSGFANDIVTLANGQEAVVYLQNELQKTGGKGPKLLILLDLNMPVMDGWEFLQQFTEKLQDAYADTRIILLSSSVDPNDIRKAKDFSMVLDFFPKPLTKEMLESIIGF